MSHPTRPKEMHLAGMAGTGQIRFLAVIPHGKGTREVAVDVPPDVILRIADALRATRGTACDTSTSRIADATDGVYHVGHAVWHVERPDQPMPCIDHSRVIEAESSSRTAPLNHVFATGLADRAAGPAAGGDTLDPTNKENDRG